LYNIDHSASFSSEKKSTNGVSLRNREPRIT